MNANGHHFQDDFLRAILAPPGIAPPWTPITPLTQQPGLRKIGGSSRPSTGMPPGDPGATGPPGFGAWPRHAVGEYVWDIGNERWSPRRFTTSSVGAFTP